MKSLRLITKLLHWENFWPLLIVLFFGWLASYPLFGSGYFNMHDDLQMMRSLQMEKCFLDGQIPCRWVPDMGYGFGFPLFNFYPPLPYLVGMLVRLGGFSFVDTAKGLFIIAFLASGISMYFFAKQFFGKIGGVLAGIFYIWAPYHAVDVYVRGAMNEAWALIWFPVILLFSYKLIINKKPHYSLLTTVYLSLSLFALFTSHNLMALIFAPVFAIWCLIWVVKEKSWKKIPHLLAAGILSLGLAAFFTFPVILEQKFVQADTLVQGYYEYTAHFATINQILLSRFWGYGGSVWMDANDKMSFQIGHIHWILSIIIICLILFKLFRTKKLPHYSLLAAVYFIVIGWSAAFMMHTRSIDIWQLFKQLQFVQFPWRFLALVIFCFSFAIGALPKLLPKYLSWIIPCILIFLLTIYNWDYFKPENGKLGQVTDQQKFSGVAWDLQRNAGIMDYLPKTAKENPLVGQSTVADVVEGEAEIINPKQGSDWSYFETNSSSNSVVRINTFLFPDWKVFVDEKQTNIFIPEEEKNGRMYINVPEGRHEVYAKLYNTPIRIISNIISLISWSFLALILLKNRNKLGKE